MNNPVKPSEFTADSTSASIPEIDPKKLNKAGAVRETINHFLMQTYEVTPLGSDFGVLDYTPSQSPITRRQAQILTLARNGLSSKRIASTLSISPGTVDNHISAAMAALGASNRSHAISKAFEFGLLLMASNIF